MPLGDPLVFESASTMSALKDRCSNAVKSLGLAFAVVEQAVVARVKASNYRQTCANLNRYPVPKLQTLLAEKGSEWNIPFRQVVEEQRPARS